MKMLRVKNKHEFWYKRKYVGGELINYDEKLVGQPTLEVVEMVQNDTHQSVVHVAAPTIVVRAATADDKKSMEALDAAHSASVVLNLESSVEADPTGAGAPEAPPEAPAEKTAGKLPAGLKELPPKGKSKDKNSPK